MAKTTGFCSMTAQQYDQTAARQQALARLSAHIVEVLEERRRELPVLCIGREERLHERSGDAGAGQGLHGSIEQGEDVRRESSEQ